MMSVDQFCRPLPDIGLFAKTRSGKDEVYKLLEKMGFSVKRVAFGDVMKERFFETFPNIPKEPKPTKLQQVYGQAMRDIDSMVWIRPTMNRVQHHKNILTGAGILVPSYIYTDIRQPNEYQAVKDTGAFMVRIDCPEEIRVARMLKLGEEVTREVLDAPTEKYLESFEADFVIHNDGDRNKLAHEVTEMVYQIQQKRIGA
ncbi:hypothetical protein HV436_01235 [Bacillus sporothermodurans]|uniref:hypothetical protein n=2 Tax=Heyndrickxia sporothermodurans TaxID=46224 RepID=UPI00192AFD7A|nr:hypothetical protein [Heyndrickxia sporothermodurans]MBL5798487.1 hypothetical protein [Heyndrickxia sporothermodurans]MBL5813039.1 hypothetical protein [Heyndrickxia sporothermodurans]MBL5816463.1 hypothetical protein [Heyndrickxia sporothermodurans]MBL5844943.1 hypothetical protein [Heyndrickxia sporothermodurans]MBL5893906.1 hypothetical protein [Heyndrickxia sporothermodurans]